MHRYFLVLILFITLGYSQDHPLLFDGVDDYVQLPDMGGYTDDFTIEIILKVNGVNGGIAYQLNTLPSGTSSNDLIASDGQVKFMTLKDDGTLQDPKSGEVVRFHLIVKNSNQPGLGGS